MTTLSLFQIVSKWEDYPHILTYQYWDLLTSLILTYMLIDENYFKLKMLNFEVFMIELKKKWKCTLLVYGEFVGPEDLLELSSETTYLTSFLVKVVSRSDACCVEMGSQFEIFWREWLLCFFVCLSFLCVYRSVNVALIWPFCLTFLLPP